MKNRMQTGLFTGLITGALLYMMTVVGCAETNAKKLKVTVEPNTQEQRVDVLIDGELFTSYIFDSAMDVLKKPVLYPLKAPDGTPVTRGYPIEPKQGERVDHPHHIGYWFNYGDVNGYDFWNNSNAITGDRANHMGTIHHEDITNTKSGSEGVLEVDMNWVIATGDTLLDEHSKFIFKATPEHRIIDRIITLTARDKKVNLDDNKEGLLGIRVTRTLEHPSGGTVRVVGPDGEPMEEPGDKNEDVSGEYLTSEGIRGTDAWGTRAKWVKLSGVVEGSPVTIAIIDHPDNVGYPTYWHARGYGLFSANPWGQEVFSDGEEELNFAIDAGDSETFKYRVVILPGEETAEEVESLWEDFTNSY